MIYLPVETSGEGEINAHSRVQMALGEAKVKAKRRVRARPWSRPGCTLDECRAYVEEHPETEAARSTRCRTPRASSARPRTSSCTSRELMATDAKANRGRPGRARRPSHGRTRPCEQNFYIGLDVGSTTVKAVVVDPATDEILWQDYQRHDTKQPEKVLEFLKRIEAEIPRLRSRATSASSSPARAAAASRQHHRRQVRAGSQRGLAGGREALPRGAARSIELGGQDAKIIIFKEDPETGTQEEDPVDERQVRRRHRRGHRQDQRQADDPRRRALRHGLRRASSCTRWPASAASSPRPTSTACRRRACRRTS